jgi:hypothetical protein
VATANLYVPTPAHHVGPLVHFSLARPNISVKRPAHEGPEPLADRTPARAVPLGADNRGGRIAGHGTP